MHLQSNEPNNPIHLSHFMHLVSAYEPCKQRIDCLGNDIRVALVRAKVDKQSCIVEQDSTDFFFVVHPSGSIDLCARMRSFTVVPPQPETYHG